MALCPSVGQAGEVLECVINISEGARRGLVDQLAEVVADDLLDLHVDAHHNRSVFTLVGEHAPRRLTRRAVDLLDIGRHRGVHPRVGIVDVVPFVPLDDSTMSDAIRARDDFARWAATELSIPCFVYGPERTLPDIRRSAFTTLTPSFGPSTPHPTAGAICVGAREMLVAYNVWLHNASVDDARRIASEIRSENVRALGLDVGGFPQVSMNLISPMKSGPMQAYDEVAARAEIDHAELVGLLPAHCLAAIPHDRWNELDVSADRTVEIRLAKRAVERAANEWSEMA